jgi:dienelactone hydrolase
VLAIPSHNAELVLRCDASREAMEVALYQRDEHGFLQPIEFKSKAFNEAQKRLAAHDREGLALLYH